MIKLITGIPGSGKSLAAIKEIHDCFINCKDTKYGRYEYLYTNISEFDIDLLKSKSKKSYKKCTKDVPFTFSFFEFKDELFFGHIYKMYQIFNDNTKTESDLVQYVKDKKFYNSLIVIDEAHNYFDRQDDVLVWFFTYHRHLFVDILLITQNKDLISNSYTKVIETFIDAQRRSRTLTKDMKYTIYASSMYNDENKMETYSIKPLPEYFELYHSGDKVKTKKYVYKFIALGAIALLVAIYMFSRVFSSITRDVKTVEENNSTYIDETYEYEEEKSLSDIYKDNYHIYIKCYKNYCMLDHTYTTYKADYIKKVMRENKLVYIYKRQTDQKVNIYEFLMTEKILYENFPTWYDDLYIYANSIVSDDRSSRTIIRAMSHDSEDIVEDAVDSASVSPLSPLSSVKDSFMSNMMDDNSTSAEH